MWPSRLGILSEQASFKLARPEANVTGLSLLATEISEKRLSLLREMLPRLGKVAILWNPGNASVVLKFKAAEAAALLMGIEAVDFQYSNAASSDAQYRSRHKLERMPSSAQTISS